VRQATLLESARSLRHGGRPQAVVGVSISPQLVGADEMGRGERCPAAIFGGFVIRRQSTVYRV
jgi:hypothetical protein